MTLPARAPHSFPAIRSRLGVILAAGAVSTALLAGCSPTTTTAEPGTDPGQTADAPAASGDFCSEFEANGGTGATVGPLQTWLVKEDILPDVQGRLDAMGDIEPPAEIADAWTIMKDYYSDLLAATEALPAGGYLTDPSLTGAPDEYQVVVDYYFATCA